jgi:hypothetical protein
MGSDDKIPETHPVTKHVNNFPSQSDSRSARNFEHCEAEMAGIQFPPREEKYGRAQVSNG